MYRFTLVLGERFNLINIKVLKLDFTARRVSYEPEFAEDVQCVYV